MATEIAKAYVQIVPSTKGMKDALSSGMDADVKSAGKSAGNTFGSSMAGSIKTVLGAVAIGKMVKDALDAGGALEQSFGGLDTLYGEASEAAKEYARSAAEAGISMNDYAEQAVSFGASLKQAFDGDVVKSAEAANVAILDMADNAAKMGTPLESIQNAYQGFAKQNYTMLDNLKLGYGGTKSEMERLLKDASKLEGAMGKSFDINNLGDVYEAIHLIQSELGLTGVAAYEAGETFTGSLNAMKASFTNLLADITTGNTGALTSDFSQLVKSLQNFVLNNALPMVASIVKALPQLLGDMIRELGNFLTTQSENAPGIAEFAINTITGLAEALVSNLPYLWQGVWSMLTGLASALLEYDWLGMANNLIQNFKTSIDSATTTILGEDTTLLDALSEWISTALPEMLNKGVEMILNLVNGIISALPSVCETVFGLIADILAWLGENYPSIIDAGFEMIGNLIAGLIGAIPDLVAALPNIFTAITGAFDDYDWLEIGKNILIGIKDGILGAVSTVVEAAKSAAQAIFDTVKGFFGIASPSKLMKEEIGAWIPPGIAVGIEGNMDEALNAMNDLGNATFGAIEIQKSRYTPSISAPSVKNYQSESNRTDDIKSAIKSALSDGVTIEWNGRNLGRLVQTYA